MSTPKQRPGFLIRRLQQSAVAIFLREMTAAGHDLTPVQYAVLASIAANPGLDQARLAGLVALDKATVGGVVDRLLAKSFIARTINPADRRSRQLVLTDRGKAEMERCDGVVDQIQGKILAGLEQGEQAQFVTLLEKLVDATNQDSRAPMA